MEKKVTKKDWFNLIIKLVDGNVNLTDEQKAEAKDFCAHEIELLDNKKKGSAKTSAKSENEKNLVYDALVTMGNPSTVSDLIVKQLSKSEPLMNEAGSVSTQKVSAILKKLVADGRVEALKDKRVTYFRIVD